jgi:P4 family phage/plasmid primase-like protien
MDDYTDKLETIRKKKYDLDSWTEELGDNLFDDYQRQMLKEFISSDKLLEDLNSSVVGQLTDVIMNNWNKIPLQGKPHKEIVFADYFCNNIYPYVCYTKEVGFYIYNFHKGVYHTEYAEAVILQIMMRLGKQIENFELPSANKLAGILHFISLHPLVFHLESDFDKDNTALNVERQFFDLCTGEIKPTRPEHMCKMTTGVGAVNAETPVFDRFLSDITCGDAAMKDFLLRFMGYALTGLINEQIFLNFFGKGKNGKSTLLELMLYIFGGYATVVPEDLIVDTASISHAENSAVSIQNKRLAVLADCSRGALNDSTIKRITGGDTIRARNLYHNSFEFSPKCKLIIGTNQKLHLRDTGESLKRRLRLVPFDYKVGTPDKTLLDKLKAEASGILYKVMREAQIYLQNINGDAFPDCERITRESQKYIDDENPFGLFFSERLQFGAELRVNTVEVWEAYKAWCAENNVKPQKKQTLYGELDDLDVKVKRSDKKGMLYYFDGVKIKDC